MMKNVLGVIVFMFLSFTAAAQNNVADTAIKNWTWEHIASYYPAFPLIIVNDKEYEGSLSDLNVNIKHIEIFKGPGASAIYGINGARGVILIGSKIVLPKWFFKPSTDSSFESPVIYIIDGNLAEKNYAIKKDIVKREVLGSDKLTNIDNRKLDSIVVITNRQYAISELQRKLANFSKDYRDYLRLHNNDDSELAYVINGSPADRKLDKVISELYSIPIQKIKSVNFLDREKMCCDFRSGLIIVTKK